MLKIERIRLDVIDGLGVARDEVGGNEVAQPDNKRMDTIPTLI
jgi:hypothetical protein